MNRIIIFIFLFLSFLIAFFVGWLSKGDSIFTSSKSKLSKIIPRPLEVYTIENLSKDEYPKGIIKVNAESTKSDQYDAHAFSFTFPPNPQKKETKTTTGLINIPKGGQKYPLIVMLRGYVDPEAYLPGVGTKKAAEVFAKEGFITLAPDFLGYADSDQNERNIFESRFQTHTLVLSLLNSLDQISDWDKKNVFIWGHSNGGQIALTVLEVTQKPIPTAFWAPVTKPFPYSILYYTDESGDRGKLIRRELASFEELYDTDKYSLDMYLDKIKAPIQLHQGTADDAVPVEWSRELSKNLKRIQGFDISYYEYPGADHNLNPSWNTVVERNLEFFRKNLQD